MASYQFYWDDETIEKLALFDLSAEDVERVICDPFSHDFSRATGRPCVFGWIPDGRYIIVVFEKIGAEEVQVRTAYPVPEP
jgi:uncharacterized DUF497 family protein